MFWLKQLVGYHLSPNRLCYVCKIVPTETTNNQDSSSGEHFHRHWINALLYQKNVGASPFYPVDHFCKVVPLVGTRNGIRMAVVQDKTVLLRPGSASCFHSQVATYYRDSRISHECRHVGVRNLLHEHYAVNHP